MNSEKLQDLAAIIMAIAVIALTIFVGVGILDRANNGFKIIEGFCLDKTGYQNITNYYPNFFKDYKLLKGCPPINCSNKDNYGCFIEVS